MRYLGLTMAELHELYVSGKATPLDVVNEVIEALTKDKNNILEKTMYEEARSMAQSLTQVEKDNLLWGIPFLVKDNIAMKGIETTCLLYTSIEEVIKHIEKVTLQRHDFPYEIDGIVVKVNDITKYDELGYTAKQIHLGEVTLIDYNRAGNPLVELVTEPDLRSADEAMAFVEAVREIVTFLEISDGKMEEGSLRCDVNISLRPVGVSKFGNKVEIKNMNSISNIGKAIETEIKRQSELLDKGCLLYTSETGHKGITYNPYGKERTRIVGGSSSGSASGVASGYVPFAVGSDTGDSIRKPASFAGLVGFKPTWGEISRFGLFAFMPTLDHVGFFTRSVSEARVLFEKTRGYDKKDATSVMNVPSKTEKEATLKGKKVAVLEPIFALMKNKLLIKEFHNLVDKLRQAGTVVDFVPFDKNLLAAIFPTYFILSCAEANVSNACLTGIGFGNKEDGASYEDVYKRQYLYTAH